MSQINLRRFVDINILHHSASSVMSTRDVVTLLSSEANDTAIDKTFSSYLEAAADLDATVNESSLAFAKVYFNNGGVKLHVITKLTDSVEALKTAIAALPDEEIVVAFANAAYADIKAIAQAREIDSTIYGINQKLLLARTTTDDADEVKNFIVKRSNVAGAEMTIAAYLSQIDVYKADDVQDYAFTKEIITAEDANDTILGECINHNMNIDMYLSNAIRNLGGNAKDGYAVTNEFCLIVLHQTATERLLSLLTEKLKGSEGLAKISTALGQELARYTTSGYLVTDKVWTDNDLTKTYNNQTYTIIRKGEQLLLGYKIVVLPLESLTEEDKAARKTPPIYVVLADAYGIRSITVNGEVI